MTAIEIRSLTVEINGCPIVSDLTLTVDEGERVGVVGEYWDIVAILDTISGFALPTSGEIWIYNMPPRQASQRGLIYTGYINQSPNRQGDSYPSLILLTNDLPSGGSEENVVIHPFMKTFYESTPKSYKFIRTILNRGES